MAEETAKLMSGAGSGLDPAERRLLAGMPLHAITSVHGEAGLRERLLMEISAVPRGRSRPGPGRAGAGVPVARGRPAAARTLRQPPAAGDDPDPEPLPGHRPGRGVRRAAARRRRGPRRRHRPRRPAGGPGGAGRAVRRRTAALVAAVTNPEMGARPRRARAVPRARPGQPGASPWARVIKASDFTDNAVGIIHTTGPKLSKLARKYGPLVPALRELILRPDTPLDADVKDMIAAQLDAAQERFAAIGHGRDGDSGVSQPPGARPGSS